MKPIFLNKILVCSLTFFFTFVSNNELKGQEIGYKFGINKLGIQAASLGLSFVAAYVFLRPILMTNDYVSMFIVLFSFLATQYTRIPSIILFLSALGIGVLLN
jgi:hypothetical protein